MAMPSSPLALSTAVDVLSMRVSQATSGHQRQHLSHNRWQLSVAVVVLLLAGGLSSYWALLQSLPPLKASPVGISRLRKHASECSPCPIDV